MWLVNSEPSHVTLSQGVHTYATRLLNGNEWCHHKVSPVGQGSGCFIWYSKSAGNFLKNKGLLGKYGAANPESRSGLGKISCLWWENLKWTHSNYIVGIILFIDRFTVIFWRRPCCRLRSILMAKLEKPVRANFLMRPWMTSQHRVRFVVTLRQTASVGLMMACDLADLKDNL